MLLYSLDPRPRPRAGKGLVHIEQLRGSQDAASHVIVMTIMNVSVWHGNASAALAHSQQ